MLMMRPRRASGAWPWMPAMMKLITMPPSRPMAPSAVADTAALVHALDNQGYQAAPTAVDTPTGLRAALEVKEAA